MNNLLKGLQDFNIMDVIRQRYIRSQEKKGVDFKTPVNYWINKKDDLQLLANKIENKKITYPSYFTELIHIYQNGHLNWNQAFESNAHMQCSAMMSVKDILESNSHINSEETEIEYLSPPQAYEIYKEHIIDSIINVIEEKNNNKSDVKYITDLGCGTAELTSLLAKRFQYSTISAVDLSPNYLSIATYNYEMLTNLQFIHANMENVTLENEQDVVIICYAFHEMPVNAIRNTIQNANKMLKTDGRIIIIDMNPEKLPTFPSFIDISEPHLKPYRSVNFTHMLRNSRFTNITEQHLHQTSYLFTATKMKDYEL